MINKAFILDYPASAPGKCIYCGSSTRHDGRKYVDFGLSIKWYGAVYWCTLCLAEVTGLFGWITPEVAEKLKLEIADLISEITNLREENDRLRSALSDLDFLSDNRIDISPSVEAFSGSDSSTEGTNNESVDNTERREETEDRSPEQVDESGSPDIFDSERPSSLSDII